MTFLTILGVVMVGQFAFLAYLLKSFLDMLKQQQPKRKTKFINKTKTPNAKPFESETLAQEENEKSSNLLKRIDEVKSLDILNYDLSDFGLYDDEEMEKKRKRG